MDLGKISQWSLNCNSGLDRLSIVLKVEKWLAEYRYYKIDFFRRSFYEMDYSVLLERLTSAEKRRLLQISKKIPLIKFTKTRVQFKNEAKVLRELLKISKISYNKKRDCYSVAENYTLNETHFANLDLSPKNLQEAIWASIPLFSLHGTGQFKFGKRLGRQRSFVNRKLKKNPFLHIQRRTIELKQFPKGRKDAAARDNVKLFSLLQTSTSSNGIILKTRNKKLPNGKIEKYVSLFRILPNGYKPKAKFNNLFKRSGKKTFIFTKKASNQHHFNSTNGRPHGNGKMEFKSSNGKLKSSEMKSLQYFGFINTEIKVTKKNGKQVTISGKMEVMKNANQALSYQLKNLHFLRLNTQEISYRKINKNFR